jgi:hypothetical protein
MFCNGRCLLTLRGEEGTFRRHIEHTRARSA